MRAVAAALKKSSSDLLSLPTMWRDSDRKIYRNLAKDAEKLFVHEFGESQKKSSEMHCLPDQWMM